MYRIRWGLHAYKTPCWLGVNYVLCTIFTDPAGWGLAIYYVQYLHHSEGVRMGLNKNKNRSESQSKRQTQQCPLHQTG